MNDAANQGVCGFEEIDKYYENEKHTHTPISYYSGQGSDQMSAEEKMKEK
jgi:hypothetical protein